MHAPINRDDFGDDSLRLRHCVNSQINSDKTWISTFGRKSFHFAHNELAFSNAKSSTMGVVAIYASVIADYVEMCNFFIPLNLMSPFGANEISLLRKSK